MISYTTPKLRLVVLLLALGFAIPSEANVPQAINFQAVARNPDGTPIANTTIALRLTVRRTSAVGTITYQERQTPITTTGGQFSVQTGKGTPLMGTFSSID